MTSLPKLSVSFTCKLKKINGYNCFPLNLLQVNKSLNLGNYELFFLFLLLNLDHQIKLAVFQTRDEWTIPFFSSRWVMLRMMAVIALISSGAGEGSGIV